MFYFKIVGSFIRASLQEEMAYRSNFWFSLFHSILNLLTGVLGVAVLFGQVDSINGWDFESTLIILGVYLSVGALRGLFIGPSLEALTGMDGEVWTGKFDFSLLRPVDVQFQASFRHWRFFRLFDLMFGMGVLMIAYLNLDGSVDPINMLAFLTSLLIGILILYSILLIFAGLVFWSPGFLFTWVFDGIFQMARYPVGLYPGWVRLVLTWIIPIGLITTVPAQVLTGNFSGWLLAGTVIFALVLFMAGTAVFRIGLRRYSSASS